MSEDEVTNIQEQNSQLPCRLHCVDLRISTSFTNASSNLKDDGLKHMCESLQNYDTPIEEPPKGQLAIAINDISTLMNKIDHRLCRGYVYIKPKKGTCKYINECSKNLYGSSIVNYLSYKLQILHQCLKKAKSINVCLKYLNFNFRFVFVATFTFVLECDVEQYLTKLQRNPTLKEQITNNQAGILKHMSNINTEVYFNILDCFHKEPSYEQIWNPTFWLFF